MYQSGEITNGLITDTSCNDLHVCNVSAAIVPQKQYAKQGERVHFDCHMKSFGGWNIGQKRLLNNVFVTMEESNVISRVTVMKANKQNSGIYKCYGHNNENHYTTVQGSLVVAGEHNNNQWYM